MRIAVVIPPGFANRWLLRVAARNLSKKHPDVVVLSHDHSLAEGIFLQQLRKYRIQVVTPPPAPPLPKDWWGRVKRWWQSLRESPWDPVEHAEAVLLFWDGKAASREAMQRVLATGKKVWVVRSTDN